MKKAIYILAALVLALNLLFTISPDNNTVIENAQAQEIFLDEPWCEYIDGWYSGYKSVTLNNCYDEEGHGCGAAVVCVAMENKRCLASYCVVSL